MTFLKEKKRNYKTHKDLNKYIMVHLYITQNIYNIIMNFWKQFWSRYHQAYFQPNTAWNSQIGIQYLSKLHKIWYFCIPNGKYQDNIKIKPIIYTSSNN